MKDADKHEPLHLQHTFLASANTLFDAWITPPVAELWLFQYKENSVEFLADAKEGGSFHTEDKNDAKKVSHSGKYITINRPHTLVFALSVPDHFEGESEVTIEIQPGEAGTILNFTQKNVDTSNNAGPWQNMFKQLEQLLIQPYLIDTKSGVQPVIEAINITLMQMAGFVLPLDDEQINKVPFKNSWTAAQLLRHIIKSLSGISGLMTKKLKAAERDPHEKILPLKQAFLDITHTMQSPDFIVPEDKKYEKQIVLDDLYNCLYALNRSIDNIDGNGLITGLPLGDVTQLELLHFVFYHAQRHLIQMKRITDALMS